MTVQEEFYPIPGYEGYYRISKSGVVKSETIKMAHPRALSGYVEKPGRVLIQYKKSRMYWVYLYKDGERRTYSIPSLLKMAIPNNMTVQEGNKMIHEWRGKQPKIEYCVGTDDSICYSPAGIGGYYPTPQMQKSECERWLKDNIERYPDGWVAAGGYSVIEIKHYPYYDNDFSELIQVVIEIEKAGYIVSISGCACSITGSDSKKFIPILIKADTKLSATYQACLEFIQVGGKGEKG